MTAHIDARGQVIAALPAHTSGALDIRVQGTEGLTPSVRFGNWPALGLALIAVLMTSAARRRRHAG
jgi:apolipoprotein N-acyltransferase